MTALYGWFWVDEIRICNDKPIPVMNEAWSDSRKKSSNATSPGFLTCSQGILSIQVYIRIPFILIFFFQNYNAGGIVSILTNP